MEREKKENYGLDVSNPIQVSSIGESYNYLSRLLTDQGRAISFERQGSISTPEIKVRKFGIEADAMVDQYEIFDENQNKITDIYICPYFDNNSVNAPKGFKYRDSSSIKEESLSNIESFKDKLAAMSPEEYKEMTIRKMKERGVEIPPDKDFEQLRQNILSGMDNPRKQDSPRNEGGSCFIATAAVGKYDDPVVVQLRIFRDQWILKQTWGEGFVLLYYQYGARVAKYISPSFLLRKISLYLIVYPLYLISKVILDNRKLDKYEDK